MKFAQNHQLLSFLRNPGDRFSPDTNTGPCVEVGERTNGSVEKKPHFFVGKVETPKIPSLTLKKKQFKKKQWWKNRDV